MTIAPPTGYMNRTQGETLHGPRDAFLLFGSQLSSFPRERVVVAHLTERAAVIDVAVVAEGDAAAAMLPVARILRGAIVRGARMLVLAHNHPSGDATPSVADIHATRRLAAGATAVGIALLDHVVLARDDARSFRLMGLI